ncbi:hypothetical protein [Archangium lipolyticum]|uniref:hypothetical protein n=1 Tax=Archangium lipolyticum TaxID=2970465 RepID=UPI00214AF77B|nr:hypothetical protein [Archangium lipolyticum]
MARLFTWSAGFKVSSLATGRAWSGFLAQDTCLTKSNGSKVICAAMGTNASGGATNWLQFDSNGYVYVASGSCTVLGPC